MGDDAGQGAFFAALSTLDFIAFALLLTAWISATWWIEAGPHAKQSISAIMDRKRADWMRETARRDQRIFDAALLNTLQNGAAFFASATLLASGGALALIAETDRVVSVVSDLPISETAPNAVVYEAKLLVMLVLIANAFLKFAWSQRLYSYCAVLIGAIPTVHPGAEPPEWRDDAPAAQAAKMLAQAGRSFSRGLRTLYISLAALAWLIGPIVSIVATILILNLILRREFRSNSRAAVAP